jgi:hypothetical protein
LESCWLVSCSHFYLLKLQHISTCIFLFHYHGLWCPVYCYERYCRFALVDNIIWLLNLRDLYLLMSARAHTSVCFLILSLFPCIC